MAPTVRPRDHTARPPQPPLASAPIWGTTKGGAPHPAAERVLDLRVRHIHVDGTVVAYVDEGVGPPVLLLHGAPMTSLGFVRVIHDLRPHHRVLAPDLPGFGGSGVPSSFGGRLEEYAAFVVRFCEALHLSTLVMYVNDTSGAFGLAAAARMRERLVGIVVADTVPIPLTGRARPVRWVLRGLMGTRLLRSLNRRFNLLPWLVVTVAPWLRPFSRSERRALLAAFTSHGTRDRVLGLLFELGRDTGFVASTAQAVRAHLSTLPALILYGQLDPMRLVGGPGRYRALLPNSELCIIPREEHFPILASGASVGAAVRAWISRRVRPDGHVPRGPATTRP